MNSKANAKDSRLCILCIFNKTALCAFRFACLLYTVIYCIYSTVYTLQYGSGHSLAETLVVAIDSYGEADAAIMSTVDYVNAISVVM